uniref:Ubiquitin-like domain-containing protein n=1 Tax=Chrysotila carterae TaxID=13221 RepID=A0A7S4ERB4_CHRCT
MQIFLRGLHVGTTAVEVEPSSLVSDVKQLIADREGIPVCDQRLVFSGKQLQNSSTLRSSHVGPAATLQIKLRLVGGTDYICGDCGQKNEIKPKDPIRCRICGYRIMYKMRTRNCTPLHPFGRNQLSSRCMHLLLFM